MEQQKVGRFLKELRKEKNLTQEQLAERLNVTGRTVSRWETGSNMPDISILVELADFYEVTIPEIIDGERKGKNMNEEVKEAALKVAEYSNAEKKKQARIVLVYFILGIIGLVAHWTMDLVGLPETFIVGVIEGSSIGIGIGAMLLGMLYVTGVLSKIAAVKSRLQEK
jgi:transcriptional regulator with XRE-family HTH domain